MTPLQIKIIRHCYSSREPWENVPARIWNSPAAKEARDMLVRAGLLEAGTLAVTPTGRAYVDALCALDPMELGARP